MQIKPPVEAILFDFDGTILDTETPDFLAWREFYSAHGIALGVELWKQRVGKALKQADMFDPGRYFEQQSGITLTEEAKKAHWDRYIALCKEQPILPGVMAILDYAVKSGIKLGVASNSDRKWVSSWMEHHKLMDYFACVYTVDDVQHPKPHPELYLATARCLGVAIDRCIAIEDSPTGMQSVNAAGIRCIAVPNYLTAHLERPHVALTLSSLAETSPAMLLAQFA